MMDADSTRADAARQQALPPELSARTRALWGKTGSADTDLWLPLYVHLEDTAEIAAILWDEWVTPGVKQTIADGLLDLLPETSKQQRETLALYLFILLALLHDTGKATPVFQAERTNFLWQANIKLLADFVESAGLKLCDKKDKNLAHALVSFAILKRNDWSPSMAVVVGAHHGKPPSKADTQDIIEAWQDMTGFIYPDWVTVQTELVEWAQQHIPPEVLEQIKACRLSKPAQTLLSGLLIMADWIASDQELFPLIQLGERADSSKTRAHEAWEHLDLAPYQEFSMLTDQMDVGELYKLRFSLNTLRPIQQEVAALLMNLTDLGIVIIEAPMGEGKTELALIIAEFAARLAGRSGLFFALPTQATSDGIFDRILKWINKLGGTRTIMLAHGKAYFNQTFQGLRLAATDVDDGHDDVIVSDWASARKRAILSDFVVGTIDQVLIGGLKQKHLMLRHLGLANKVVIIDECHAYDAYMNQYLYKVLSWLSAYKVPVVVLSATLPADRRHELLSAYASAQALTISEAAAVAMGSAPTPETASESKSAAALTYPLVTYTSGGQTFSIAPPASGRKRDIQITQLADCNIVGNLSELLVNGGCVGIIVNTVTRAQNLAHELSEAFGEDTIVLLHSRFIAPDRIERERLLREQLGYPGTKRPEKLIVVGTQVLEQSLDIDFDIMITDICPMDLLLQRLGRLHRHDGRTRAPLLSKPQCYVTGIEGDGRFHSGSEHIYGTYLLMNTQALLPERIVLPNDIAPLVQTAYGEDGVEIREELRSDYREAKAKHDKKVADAAKKAEAFQIGEPATGQRVTTSTIIGWLDTDLSKDPSGKRAEVTVRDAADSIQVLVIQQKQDGRFFTLPWLKDFGDRPLPTDFTSDEPLAKAVASCVINLPASMCAPWLIDKVIAAFEKDCCEKLPVTWQQSPWLQGELFLILDEDLHAEFHIATSRQQQCFKLHYDEQYGLYCERTVTDG
jgi:CRISPR-associated endonuclease/helicase Cas3